MSLDTVEKICFKEKNENNPIKQTKTNNITKLCGRSAHKPRTVFETGGIFDFTISIQRENIGTKMGVPRHVSTIDALCK